MNVIHENILVEVVQEVKEAGGIMLPDDGKDSRIGNVVTLSIGEAVPTEVKEKLLKNNKIKFKEFFDGEKFDHNEKSFIVMNYKDILIIY